MKKLLFILTATFSFNVMAGTTLICNDQNSHSVYKLKINNDASAMVFTPISKDSSTLSRNALVLDYNEGESNETYSLYEGKNADQNTIVLEVKNKEIVTGKIVEVNVYFSKNISRLDQKTLFLCNVKVDNKITYKK